MAAEGNVIRYIITGLEERDERGVYIVPGDATHASVHQSVKVLSGRLFEEHENIVELICHDGVDKIESSAFGNCPRLRRIIIPGVEVLEGCVFSNCEAVVYVECRSLERIGEWAFSKCTSLTNINLPSAKIVESFGLSDCHMLKYAKFGEKLESFQERAFEGCHSLEGITIPLKNYLITADNIFKGCDNLRHLDLVEEAVLRATVQALQLQEWRNDMNDEIDSINEILPNASAGYKTAQPDGDTAFSFRCVTGKKALVIREWIARVLSKIIHYKAEHRSLLNETASVLELVLRNEIVINNVLSFLDLPSHMFDGEKERVAELRGEVLFQQPESSHLGDCPICFLPMPLDPKQRRILSCCSKSICNGCAYANKKRELKDRLKHRCLFCRKPLPLPKSQSNSDEETKNNYGKRAEANDRVALREIGVIYYNERDYDSAFKNVTRAAAMGDAEAHYFLSLLYRYGHGVEKDEDKKMVHHLEEASIAGHPVARHDLGCHDELKQRYDRAAKHFIIAANLGFDMAIKAVGKYYRYGYVSKEDYEAALYAYQAAVDDAKSPQREEAAKENF